MACCLHYNSYQPVNPDVYEAPPALHTFLPFIQSISALLCLYVFVICNGNYTAFVCVLYVCLCAVRLMFLTTCVILLRCSMCQDLQNHFLQDFTILWLIWYDMIWYDMIWYDMIYDMIWYMIWYDMIWYDMIWYDMIWYDMIWYDMIWYDTIHLLTTIGLTPGGSITVHIYTQTVHRTTQIIINLEECGQYHVFASYTLAFALQLRKKHG